MGAFFYTLIISLEEGLKAGFAENAAMKKFAKISFLCLGLLLSVWACAAKKNNASTQAPVPNMFVNQYTRLRETPDFFYTQAGEIAQKAVKGKILLYNLLIEKNTLYYLILLQKKPNEFVNVMINAQTGEIIKTFPARIVSDVENRIKQEHYLDINQDGERLPLQTLEALKLKPGATVADIGCGAGYFTFLLLEKVQPQGKVYALDTDPESLEIMKERLEEISSFYSPKGLTIQPSRPDDLCLPENTLDLAFICNVPVTHTDNRDTDLFWKSVYRSLKKGGKLVLINYLDYQLKQMGFKNEAENLSHFKHKLAPLGFKYQGSKTFIPNNFFYIFAK